MYELYFEDLSTGMQFQSKKITVTEEEIIAFAQQFDPQPFHLDKTAAEKTFFRGLVASGWHTASLSMRLLTETLTIAGGLIGSGGELKWLLPVRPDDQLSLNIEITDLRRSQSQLKRGYVYANINVSNQDNETVQFMQCEIVVLCRY